MDHSIDVLVIGASQAGLAMGYYLKRRNIKFTIIGKEERVGEVWRKRYDSLVLFTPRQYSSLPGMPLDGDPGGYAAKDEIADYLEAYARRFELPVRLNTEAIDVRQNNGVFSVRTSRGDITAKQVVIATGPFQQPFIPQLGEGLSNDVYQTHTSQYVNPSALQDGSVLVVGAGNSGAQIAVELAQARPVTLSVGHGMKFFPLEAFGKSIFWWFDKLGILRANIDTRAGRLIRKRSDPIFGRELQRLIRQGKVKVKPRVTGVNWNTVTFADGTTLQPRNVVWATGFRSDYDWLKLPDALDDYGRPAHQRGVTPVRGLYFLGLPWQYRRGSALIGGVGTDAEYLIDYMQREN